MISINDTHEAPKAAPTYRIRDEAKNAAIAVLGPLAIHEFDFVTFQLDDGRWDWNVPVEERPLSNAVIKANGGKKFLQARAAAKASEPKTSLTAMATAITEGTPMADPNRLPVPPRRAIGKAAGASEAPKATEQPPAPENEPVVPPNELVAIQGANGGRVYVSGVTGTIEAGQTISGGGKITGLVYSGQPDESNVMPACNGLDIEPHDDLRIPSFLQREKTPEAKEQAAQAMKRIAKQVGPDRTIENPPDTKAKAKPSPTAIVPGTDTSKWGKDRAARRKAKGATSAAPVSDSPKSAKRASNAPAKKAGASKGQSKTAMVGEMLMRAEGCTSAEVLAATGWPAVSMPQQAKACGLTLRKEKDLDATGKRAPTRYFGSKG